MTLHLIAITRASLLAMCLSPVAFGFQQENQSYLPLTQTELSQRFAVEYVGTLSNGRPGYFENMPDKPMSSTVAVGVSGASFSISEDEGLTISGKDKSNQVWSAMLGISPIRYACRVYVTDLDRNGIRDLVLVFPTGGNGLAPTSHIFTLTFDELGRPVPFEADGYFGETEQGIVDLVDLDRDGSAELIYMNFNEGYWITNLYEISSARWQLVKGQHAKRSYPMFTRFTNAPNQKPVIPKRGRHPIAPDLSNGLPKIQGHLISYKWADVSQSEDILLTVKTKEGKTIISKPDSWHASFAVVIDSKDGRRIISLSTSEETMKSAFDEIVKGRYSVALYGQRGDNTSSPEILWASSR